MQILLTNLSTSQIPNYHCIQYVLDAPVPYTKENLPSRPESPCLPMLEAYLPLSSTTLIRRFLVHRKFSISATQMYITSTHIIFLVLRRNGIRSCAASFHYPQVVIKRPFHPPEQAFLPPLLDNLFQFLIQALSRHPLPPSFLPILVHPMVERSIRCKMMWQRVILWQIGSRSLKLNLILCQIFL